MNKKERKKTVLVRNVAPQATEQDLRSVFGIAGEVKEVRILAKGDEPTLNMGKMAYISYADYTSPYLAQHLTGHIYKGWELICMPVKDKEVIQESGVAIESARNGSMIDMGPTVADTGLPLHVTTRKEGFPPKEVWRTYDPKLEESGLQGYPLLERENYEHRIDEVRRTVIMKEVESKWTLEEISKLMEAKAGKVRWICSAHIGSERSKAAMIEFDKQEDVIAALKMNGKEFEGSTLKIVHSTTPIEKPQELSGKNQVKSGTSLRRKMQSSRNRH